jgi:DNA-binding MarR family transcriptional regulator
MYELFAIMEAVGPLVTLQTMKAFVAIAMANDETAGLNMTELGKRLGLPSATRTNVVNALSVRRAGANKVPGLDLVLTAPDPDDSRAKVIFLTPKGRRLWAALKHIMES